MWLLKLLLQILRPSKTKSLEPQSQPVPPPPNPQAPPLAVNASSGDSGKVIELVSRRELLMNRDTEYPLSPAQEANLAVLLLRINRFRMRYGKPLIVTSGYRPGKYNTIAGGAPNSAHLTCEAVDFADTNREVTKWVLANPQVLIECDLYMEAPEFTPSWIHLQSRAVRSGRRIFQK